MRALRNTWYTAAWAEEVLTGTPLRRTLLAENVLLFRDESGRAHAINNRCPHRFAPLDMGKQVGDAIECRYHGLQFGGDGKCVFNPHGNGAIPPAARVRAYPTAEKYGMIWIWVGDPELADPTTVPFFEILEPADFGVGRGYLKVNGNYELESDNILDLSHIEFLHPMFSTEAVRRGKTESSQEGDMVWSKRLMTNDFLPPYLAAVFGIDPGTAADRWLDCRWRAPALIELFAGATQAGRPREEGRSNGSIHFFTPETEKSTHYFYAMCYSRSRSDDADQIAAKETQDLRVPFTEEDLPVIEAQQRMIGDADFMSLKPLLLPGDAGGTRARRILSKLIKDEESARST